MNSAPIPYGSLEELHSAVDRLGLDLPLSEDFGVFAQPVPIGDRAVPNRLAVHPMEAGDCTDDGAPTELTRRRYLRYARGGAGLIWFEACAVRPDGRSSPRQAMLTEENLGRWAALLEEMRKAATAAEPLLVLQLTHSGRYSKPDGRPSPVLVRHCPELDRWQKIPEDYPLLSDAELDELADHFVRAAGLARRAGFDGVDVKACHGYLAAELLAAHTRTGSRYGGPDLQDRSRFLRQVHRRVHEAHPDLLVACRLNAWDPLPPPYGWGVDAGDPPAPDLTEPLELAGELREQGASCLSVTVGNPRFYPHYNRPSRRQDRGEGTDEHPLVSLDRLVRLTGRFQTAYPELVTLGAGYSCLGRLMPHVAAGVLKRGWASMVGVGRGAFAYPDFARDLLEKGVLDPEKVCITCDRCGRMLREGVPAGCPVRDGEVYPVEGRDAAPGMSGPR